MIRSPDRLLIIALGETEALGAHLAAERFPSASVVWLHRSAFRHPTWQLIRALWGGRPGDVLVCVPDLSEARARLTTLLAALPRARRRWIADRTGRFEPFSFLHQVGQEGRGIARHLVTWVLAMLLAGSVLRVLVKLVAMEVRLGKRRMAPTRARRLMYMRSQFWTGLLGGGSVAHSAGVIGGLQRMGVDVTVVTSDRLRGVDARTILVPPEVWFDGQAREIEELAYNAPFTRAGLRAARTWAPDVLYQRFTAFNVSGAILSRLLGIPFALEFNSSDVWKGDYWGGVHLRRFAEQGERINLNAADLVVVVSTVLRDSLVERGIRPSKILVNPNGADLTRFRPDVDGSSVRARYGLEGRIVVGFSGTFGVWHGIPTLAKAIPLVLEALPEARFLLVGEGGLRHVIVDAAETAGVRERVIFTGLLPHEQMPAHLAACDVLVSPHGAQADGAEFFGSPTKLYEYMAAGRPIVASAVGQIRDVLMHESTALLVPPDDAAALAAAIVRLGRDASLRARLAEAARAAAAGHTWESNARNLLEALAVVQSGSTEALETGRNA